LFEYLVVDVSVNVTTAGTYEIYGNLNDGFGSGINSAYNETFLDLGVQIVELRFNGYGIRSHAVDGPFVVYLYVYCDRTLDEDTFNTSAYAWSQFEIPPSLSPPNSDHGLDTDEDGLFDYLVVDVVVSVPSNGTFEFEAVLIDGLGHYLGSCSNTTYLTAGLDVVELRFAGWVIRENGVSGPFRVYLNLATVEGDYIDSDNYLSYAYLPYEFELPLPSFLPPWSDDFELGTLEGSTGVNWSSTDLALAGVSDQTAGSGAYSMFISGGYVEVKSYYIDLSGLTSVELRVWIQRGDDSFSEDPDFGDDLEIWYEDANHDWQKLDTLYGEGAPGETYGLVYSLPTNALHSMFRIKFVQIDGDGPGTDYWRIDNVYVGPPLV